MQWHQWNCGALLERIYMCLKGTQFINLSISSFSTSSSAIYSVLFVDIESKMATKVLLVSAVLVGLVSLSSCRSLAELSEQKTYSSAPSCIIFSDPIPFV